MTDWIRLLPPEVVLQILSNLSFNDLLAFGATSRLNNDYHIASLRCLRLGVFEKRVHSIISLLQAGWASPEQLGSTWVDNDIEHNYTISIVQHQRRAIKQWPLRRDLRQNINPSQQILMQHDRPQTQEQMIRLQNQIFAGVLQRYGCSLRNLEFMAYDLNLEGATALGSYCQNTLRSLALRFEHPHIRDGVMRPSIWLHPAPANEGWNSLIGVGRTKNIGLFNLECLILERAGITSWQLMMLVKRNPSLMTLKLRTCRGATPEFLYWLGGLNSDLDDSETRLDGPAPGANLEVLALEHCHRLLEHPIDECNHQSDGKLDSGFEWVRGLSNLRSLSFSESTHIPSKLIDRANKTIWKIPEVILPYGPYDGNTPIAVDPRWE
ncbi:F-box protein [Aspergillus foveolatus]|uniref:F-box protein n=1 Tax=Aspergillus foveolatus TaxID=210207 RepID=UPI003CCD3C56